MTKIEEYITKAIEKQKLGNTVTGNTISQVIELGEGCGEKLAEALVQQAMANKATSQAIEAAFRKIGDTKTVGIEISK